MTTTSFPIPAAQAVIVTGGAQGIGREFVSNLAVCGNDVVIADRQAEAAEQLADELRGNGLSAIAVACDVTSEASVADLVSTTIESFGRVDALINNAAIFSTIALKPFEQISKAEWDAVVDVNLTGAFLCSQAVSPHMRAQRSGSIVNISSATALFGRANYLHYVTSKSGIIGLTRGLARELGSSNITVNAILPGSVETEVQRDITPEQVTTIIGKQSIQRRLCTEDIVGALLFLISDGARAISGQSIVVDGGANFV
jgi:3-oxoacyl-[acyl-carrier protein] reductase